MYYVYIGRFSPIHKGHQNVINTMIRKAGVEKSILLIGSCASALGERLTFTYSQRKEMIKILYPNLTIIGIPDYKDVDRDPNYKQWHENLWDLIKLKFPDANYENTTFIGGSGEDLFFFKPPYQIEIVDRHDDMEYSATEVRELLWNMLYNVKLKDHREISDLCDSLILPIIRAYFYKNFKES
jgi:hypothetical protein